MDKTKIDEWAKSFVSDLHVGNEVVPLDRVLARHLDAINELRTHGLTWGAVASIIARAGGQRASGRPISPDQLRANVARLRKRRDDASPPLQPIDPRLPRATQLRAKEKGTPATVARTTMKTSTRRMANSSEREITRDSKEISKGDIAAALARIQTK